MLSKVVISAAMSSVLFITGCASVPMASKDTNTALKSFSPPPTGKAGLYIYRNTLQGQSLKKTVSIDGYELGQTANKVFFYKQISPGLHTLATESEFSDNQINFQAESGKNYFAEQYIKYGVFVGGAGIRMVEEQTGKQGVLKCNLAEQQN